jgi:hypothetical protein
MVVPSLIRVAPGWRTDLIAYGHGAGVKIGADEW